ncbi:MAG: hypothetical protein IJ089_01330 [Clostridia bacterium]|nr:hypothetical protein [Clostridia bacterium]
MENVLEWANSLGKGPRNKPTSSLQADLFDHILGELEKDCPSYSDCVRALVKFDKKVLEPFYLAHYAGFSLDQQREWDKALHDWADEVKPTKNATMRIVPIIRYKLNMIEDVSRLEHELRWLSLHEDERSVQEFIQLRDRTDEPNLRKLLTLDLAQWRSGHAQIEKMYSILFSQSTDETTRKLYEEFLKRIGKMPSQEAVEATPDKTGEHENAELPLEAESETDNEKEAEVCASIQGKQEQPSGNDMPGTHGSIEDNEKGRPDDDRHIEQTPQADKGRDTEKYPSNGIALAGALLEWAKDINERCLSQARQIADLQAANQKASKRNSELEVELRDMGNVLSETQLTLRSRENELKDAHAQIEAMKEKESEARDTIGRIQHMSNNSVKQELDGFKHALSDELKKTVADFGMDVSDLSEAEQADVYKALFEEMLDTLTHNGIVIEEN